VANLVSPKISGDLVDVLARGVTALKEYGVMPADVRAQLAGDLLAGRASTKLAGVVPSYRPGVTLCDLLQLFPRYIVDSMREALPLLGRKLRGFDHPDAVLTAPETRSSSPVRIPRGADLVSLDLQGVYPCGEGAGYAGGITSAAVDGVRCAEAVLSALRA